MIWKEPPAGVDGIARPQSRDDRPLGDAPLLPSAVGPLRAEPRRRGSCQLPVVDANEEVICHGCAPWSALRGEPWTPGEPPLEPSRGSAKTSEAGRNRSLIRFGALHSSSDR